MKKVLSTSLVLALFLLSACKKDKADTIQKETETAIASGNWKITTFIDSGKDELNHFVGYTFTFASSGSVNATDGTNSFDGTWSISDSNSDDDSVHDLHFNLNFNLSNDFEDLNDDWEILSQSETKIELRDVSGGNGGTDYLTFEKK